jgi:predicted homoserine dehydrogenase-like protein
VKLAERARGLGRPIADYVIAPKAPAGVFITCTNEFRFAGSLEYFKLGPGPYYTLVRTYHLCHLEVPRTIGACATR